MDHIINQAFDNLRMHNELMAIKAKCERLTEENERLRKAGNALAILQCFETDEQHKRRCVKDWIEAKEGKQS